MVAQCASLLHKLGLAGWELMQFPWVKTITGQPGNGAAYMTLLAISSVDSGHNGQDCFFTIQYFVPNVTVLMVKSHDHLTTPTYINVTA